MATALYLAMTEGEFAAAPVFPGKPVWLGCRFSPEDGLLTGLSPAPAGAAVMVNDSFPFSGCDPETIIRQLRQFDPENGVILDFQRPGIPAQQALVRELVRGLTCPVIVSDLYAENLSCPVFLSPCPHHVHLRDHILPWQGRELWLDLAKDAETITLTPAGANIRPFRVTDLPEAGHHDEGLHCHYTIETGDDFARFTLWRTREDLLALEKEAQSLGIQQLVRLWCEWQDGR